MEEGAIFAFKAEATVTITHEDKAYSVGFFELADGSGWVHDFNPDMPKKRYVKILVKIMMTVQ